MPANWPEQLKSVALILLVLFGILYLNEPAQARGDVIDLCVYPKTDKAGNVTGFFYSDFDKATSVKIPKNSLVAGDEKNGYVTLRVSQKDKSYIGWVKMKDVVIQDNINCEW